MKSHTRFRKAASILIAFILVLTMAPMAVFAEEYEYSNGMSIYSGDGISITLMDRAGIDKNISINFTVIVDGETRITKTVSGVPTTTSVLNVTADGYDVNLSTKGMSATEGVNGNYDLGYDITTDEHNCTINLATSKTKDDITIGAGTTTYGVFHWSKQHAGTSAYARDIEIYVNGEYAYTQTVNTPELLNNTSGSNDQFWFTPSENYNDDYEMSSDTLDIASRKDLRIDLTTKCACGLDTCLCEGGCDCPTDCNCDFCTGNILEDNQIDTGYGILEYDPKTQEDGGYKLQVRINLNGQIVYTSDWLWVSMGLPGNLHFTPTAGEYEFQTPNDYNISTLLSGSTWIQGTGQLSIVGATSAEKNFDNVLTINLVSFSNSVALDVEREPNVIQNVIGYRVSYTVDGTDYSYDYYDFSAAQVPSIPTNTPVTITAICNSPFEVAKWFSSFDLAGNITLEGSEGESGTEAYGNSATLTVNSVTDTRIMLRIKSLDTVSVPTKDDLTDPDTGLLRENAVKIDCTNKEVPHDDGVYGLIDGTFEIGELAGNSADGYTCDVTITNPQAYVDKYNETLPDHVLDPNTQGEQSITLLYVDGAWTVPSDEAPVTYTVACETTDPVPGEPEAPDKPTVEGASC